MNRSLVGLALVALVGVPLLLPVFSASPSSPPSPSYAAHAPILIVGNAEFTGANGVVSGTGTPADPFVISGWSINASAANGIEIRNTTASFLIQGVEVHWGAPWSHDGVHLVNVENGAVELSQLSNNSAGVWIYGGSNLAVAACELSDNGIFAFSAASVTVADTNLTFRAGSFSAQGLRLFSTSDATIRTVRIEHPATGIQLNSDRGTTLESTTVNATAYAVLANASADLKVLRSDLSTAPPNYYAGVALWGVSNAVVAENNITQFDHGVYAVNALNVSLQGNNVSYSREDGINLAGTGPVWVTGNVLWRNVLGLYGQTGAGGRGDGPVIYHNAFVGNAQQVLVHLSGIWNASYPVGGNYWSDYSGVDQCSGPLQDTCTGPDGIGDTPYVIDANNSDRYPLMDLPGPIDYPPAASFTLASDSATAPANVSVDASTSWDAETSLAYLQVRWDWNADGVWDTAWTTTKTAQHTFTSPGPVGFTYTIVLEVMDGAGWTANASRTVQVQPTPMSVTIAASPLAGTMPLTVSVSSTVSGGVSPYAYGWTFGDGSTSSLANTVHIYVTGGNFTIWLFVNDGVGDAAQSNVLFVNVTPALVNLTVTIPTEFIGTSDGILAPFSASVTGGTPPYTYFWDFGDGSQSTLADPIHSYANPGNYTVSVTVTDAYGHSATQRFTVLVPPHSTAVTSPLVALALVAIPTTAAVVFAVLWLAERRRSRRPPIEP